MRSCTQRKAEALLDCRANKSPGFGDGSCNESFPGPSLDLGAGRAPQCTAGDLVPASQTLQSHTEQRVPCVVTGAGGTAVPRAGEQHPAGLGGSTAAPCGLLGLCERHLQPVCLPL